MQLQGLLPNVIVYITAISDYEKGHLTQVTKHLLQEMLLQYLLPNMKYYKLIISGCEKGQPIAYNLIATARPKGMSPQMVTLLWQETQLPDRGPTRGPARDPARGPV